jgi:phosphoenolpyruvate carboxykinase (ATP)
LTQTRAIIDAIHAGRLVGNKTVRDPVFGIDVITECPGVPSEMLIPRNTWADKKAYDAKAQRLAELFRANFVAYSAAAEPAVSAAEPVIV